MANVNASWYKRRLLLLAILMAAAVFTFAVSSSLAPCQRAFAQTSCDVGDTESFTGPTSFTDEIQVGSTPSAGTSGQFLATNGAGSAPSWTSITPILSAVKTSDETISSDNTPNIDSELVLSLEASTIYAIDGHLEITSGATPDFSFQLNGTVGGTAAILTDDVNDATQTSGLSASQLSTDGTFTLVSLSAVIETSSAGTLGLYWSQWVSDASNTTLHENSWLRATPLN